MLAFPTSIIWIYFTANTLMDFLEFVQLLTGLNRPMLAMTLIAWGNSIGGRH